LISIWLKPVVSVVHSWVLAHFDMSKWYVEDVHGDEKIDVALGF